MKRTLLSVIFLSISSASVFAQTTSSSASKINIGGVADQVTVRRDERSIPYIEAKSDADAYFAQGFVTASDRLWQMDLMRRLARGETAEIFGKATLEEDKRWRRFNFSKIAEEGIQFLTPDLRAALDSYAKGVNAYIATLDDKTLPVEFRILRYKPREWRSPDTIVIGKILSDALSSTWRNDLMRASIQNLPKEKIADLTNQVTPYDVVLFGKDNKASKATAAESSLIVEPSLLAKADEVENVRRSSLERVGLYAEELAASNNWVISGKLTADGKPIIANDPHLAPTAPGIWYLTHISTPTMRVSGVTFPGVPGIILGHNENIAWGATNVGPDVQDLYVETFNEKGEYKTPGGWKAAVIRKEIIKVRPNPLDPKTDDLIYEVTETDNGPIMLEDGGKRYALKWTAFDPKNSEFETFYEWNRSKDWTEFKTALKKYGGAAQNFVYADVKGNIGWYAASKIPMRRTGDGALPYDGSTNEGDWTGFIPFEELPNLYNPPSGLIVTANQRIVGTSYKYTQMSRDSAAPWRARRIYDVLTSKKKLTMDDVRDAQLDVLNIPVSNLAKRVVELNSASPETLAVLRSWDGKMTSDSLGATLANEIRGCAANKIAEANSPAPAYVIRERILDMAAVKGNVLRWLPAGYKSFGDLFNKCDAQIRTELANPKRMGADPSKWVWGNEWRSNFSHPLAVVPLIGGQFRAPQVALNGSGQTPNVGSYVSMRLIASPGDWDATRHVIPLGESGDPASAHFKDQFDLWRTGTPAVFPFSKAAVEKATLKTLIIEPK